MARRVLGLDIGGANLKAADSDGSTAHVAFALWKHPRQLAEILSRTIHEFSCTDLLAVTMTGEQCDCFANQPEGVQAILDAVVTAAGDQQVWIWQNKGRFATISEARASPRGAAAANWLALAEFACRMASEGAAIMVDIGSTTADIVPLLHGRPAPNGRSDTERLKLRELVYTGVKRTPVCALLGAEGAAELFATTMDVNLLLGHFSEQPGDSDTADGRPATRAAATARLARMLCADTETLSEDAVTALASRIFEAQAQIISKALAEVVARLPIPCQAVLTSGSGEFLANAAIAQTKELESTSRTSLAVEFGEGISKCACALAVAVLAREAKYDP
jgi:probable H4MPT-linked C1 transfer pathway protein